MTRVECGELVCAVADNGNTLGFEIFKRKAEVEYAFCTCADDHDGGVSQLLKVGGNVHGCFRAAVNAADAAGREYTDAGHVCDHHGSRNGGGTVCLAGNEGCEIAAACLCDISSGFPEILYLRLGKTCLEPAADDGDGGRNRAVFTNGLLNEQSGFHISGVGHTVRNNGAFKGNNGLAVIKSFGNLGRNVKILVHVFYLL